MDEIQNQIQELQRYYGTTRKADAGSLAFYQQIEDKDAVDERNYGRSLLHLAAAQGDVAAVSYLLEAGAKAAVSDRYGATPLHVLAEENRLLARTDEAIAKTAELLLDHRVSPLRKNEQGNTAYHLAAQSANLPLIRVLLERKVKMNMSNNQGNTMLHLLAETAGRNMEGLRFAYNDEAKQKIEMKDGHCFEIAKALVDYGLDIDALNNEGKKAYEIAAERNAGAVAIVLQGEYDESDAAMDLKIASKGKFLQQAIRDGDIEAVKALIALGADVNDVYQEVPFRHQTPLAVACMQMQCEIVDLLLHAGADPNFKTGEEERSALYWLIKYCQYNQDFYKEKRLDRVLRSLLDAGLDIDASVDEKGNTAIGCACSPQAPSSRDFSYGRFSEVFAQTLLSLGADVNLKNKAGKTPLMEFVEDTYYPRDNGLLDLLENGADVSLKDGSSETVLMKAARNRNHNVMVQMVEIMAEFGDLDVDAVNDAGQTALDIATENNNEALVKWILERMI